MPTSPSPLAPALDRLRFEAQYLTDVLHLAGAGGQVTISTASVRKTLEGLGDVIQRLELLGPLFGGVPPADPAAGKPA
jgi:hypothetical protein